MTSTLVLKLHIRKTCLVLCQTLVSLIFIAFAGNLWVKDKTQLVSNSLHIKKRLLPTHVWNRIKGKAYLWLGDSCFWGMIMWWQKFNPSNDDKILCFENRIKIIHYSDSLVSPTETSEERTQFVKFHKKEGERVKAFPYT